MAFELNGNALQIARKTGNPIMSPPKTFLLVDDDQDDQFFFTEALAGLEDAVLFDIVPDGVEALNLLEHSPVLPSFIIMDMNMPRMNGLECLVRLQANPLTKGIPVIFLTGSPAEMKQALELGAKAYLTKSSHDDVLRTQLKSVLHSDCVN
jgi:CheY-like chemotaxis protein